MTASGCGTRWNRVGAVLPRVVFAERTSPARYGGRFGVCLADEPGAG